MEWTSIEERYPETISGMPGNQSAAVLLYDGQNVGIGRYDYNHFRFVIEHGNVNPEQVTHWSLIVLPNINEA